jgi:uncharacterized protein YodC (DUF2158 family)
MTKPASKRAKFRVGEVVALKDGYVHFVKLIGYMGDGYYTCSDGTGRHSSDLRNLTDLEARRA